MSETVTHYDGSLQSGEEAIIDAAMLASCRDGRHAKSFRTHLDALSALDVSLGTRCERRGPFTLIQGPDNEIEVFADPSCAPSRGYLQFADGGTEVEVVLKSVEKP